MAVSGDFAEIEQLKKSIAGNVRTVELIGLVNLLDVVSLTTAQKKRYVLHAVSAENFTMTINRIINENELYQIKVVVCFARDDVEQNKLHSLIVLATRNAQYHRLVFIDASANQISRDIFNRWVDNSASEKYWRGSFVYYPATQNLSEECKGISCQNMRGVIDELKTNTRRFYQYSFDDIGITDTLFLASNLKKFPEVGIKQESFSMLKPESIEILLGGVWQINKNYWEVLPNLSISRLKIELDALIKSELEKNIRISFDDILKYLLERGFMPLNVYAFLTGFLLKEYAADPYRFSAGIDGNLGGAMNPQKLAECISDSIRQVISPTKNYRPKYLELMSQNQRQFMNFASKIFGVVENVSVEQSAQQMRLKMQNLGCPFWCYVNAADSEHKDFLKLLSGIANSKQTVSISALAERAGQFLSDNPEALRILKKFLTAQNGREIFAAFLKNFENGIIFDLAQKIGIDSPVAECRRRLTAGDGIWLHDRETAEDELKKLIVDYRLIVENQKFSAAEKFFRAA